MAPVNTVKLLTLLLFAVAAQGATTVKHAVGGADTIYTEAQLQEAIA